MKHLNKPTAVLLTVLLMGNTVFAIIPADENIDDQVRPEPMPMHEMKEERKEKMMEMRTDHMEQRMEKAGVEKPDGWDDMTPEEQRAVFMKIDDIKGESQRMHDGDGPKPWMAPEMMKQRLEEKGVELPENWEEMTAEEKKELLQANGVNPERVRNYMKKAKKARHYKKFKKAKREVKEFADENDMNFKEAIQELYQRGILDGYGDGTFGPQNPINRAESLKVLLEALGEDVEENGETDFSDVPEGAWFAKYVRKAKMRGIVKGYEDGSFKPGQTVNQVELLKIAFESFGIDLSSYEGETLPEGIDGDAWFAPYLQYALDNDLLDEEMLEPGQGMTRELFSEVIHRLIQQQEALEE